MFPDMITPNTWLIIASVNHSVGIMMALVLFQSQGSFMHQNITVMPGHAPGRYCPLPLYHKYLDNSIWVL